MVAFVLQAVERKRRTYALSDLGCLHFLRPWSDAAVLEVEHAWWLARPDLLRHGAHALPMSSEAASARLRLDAFSHRGTLAFGDLVFDWRCCEDRHAGWTLSRAGVELAHFTGTGRGSQPVRVTVPATDVVPPLALILGCWWARRLARRNISTP